MPAHIPEKIACLTRRIASTRMWLEAHGRYSKKPRPEHEIDGKEDDLKWMESMLDDYTKSLERHNGR